MKKNLLENLKEKKRIMKLSMTVLVGVASIYVGAALCSTSAVMGSKDAGGSSTSQAVTTASDTDEVVADAEVQYKLGLRYEKGDGVVKDMEKAVECYKRAVAQGHADAMNNLGVYYYSKLRRWWEAFDLFQKAADKGHIDARYHLGLCYLEGKGVDRDKHEAFYILRDLAEKGHAGAQYHLGVCYKDGEGVALDKKKAFEWFKQAADQGHVDALREDECVRMSLYGRKRCKARRGKSV